MADKLTHITYLATALLERAEAVLEEEERPVELAHITSGERPTMDTDYGQLFVTVAEVTPDSTNYSLNCGPDQWAVRFEVGVFRCIAKIDDRASTPSAETMTSEGLQSIYDLYAIERAVDTLEVPEQYLTRLWRWQPVGPRGGIAGGYWQLEALVPAS